MAEVGTMASIAEIGAAMGGNTPGVITIGVTTTIITTITMATTAMAMAIEQSDADDCAAPAQRRRMARPA